MQKTKILKIVILNAMVLGLGIFAFSYEVQAATIYYVDKDCTGGSTNYSSANNTCAGGSETAYETIQACANAILAGETCLIRAGTYYERITFTKSGSASGDLMLKAYSGEAVIIDGSSAMPTGNWTETAAGSTVYKHNGFSQKVYALFDVVGNEYKSINWMNGAANSCLCTRQLGNLSEPECLKAIISNAYDGDWWKGMQAAPNATINGYYLDVPPYDRNDNLHDVNYVWSIPAKFVQQYAGDPLYLAFQDDSNPTNHNLRWAPAGQVINTNGQNYITVDGVILRGGQDGIDVSGSNHVTLKNSTVYVATYGWHQNEGGGTHSILNNNFIYSSHLDNDAVGPFEGCNGSDNVASCRKTEYTYHFWHCEHGGNGPNDIYMSNVNDPAGTYLIDGNKLGGVYQGIFPYFHRGNLTITNNTCSDTDVCIIPQSFDSGAENTVWQFSGNKLSNSNILFRFLSWDIYYRNRPKIYMYNNLFWNYGREGSGAGDGVGMGIYFHYMYDGTNTMPPNDLWIYHNTFAGGAIGIGWGGWLANDKPYDQVKTHIVNNVFSTEGSPFRNSPYQEIRWLKDCDYNYITGHKLGAWGNEVPGDCVNYLGKVKNNICRGYDFESTSECVGTVAEPLWSNTTMPSFNTAGTLAENAGIDISKTFTLNGQSYQALPGFAPGYAGPDGKPDMGAVQMETLNPADVNEDTRVNIKDIQEVIRCIININSCAFPARSDVNGDGSVNIKDIQEIIRGIIA